jgi:hypothetical protein
MIVAAVRQSRAEPVVRHHFPHSGDVQGSCGPWCALIEPSRVPAGPADPADIGGKQGNWYRRDLAVYQP